MVQSPAGAPCGCPSRRSPSTPPPQPSPCPCQCAGASSGLWHRLMLSPATEAEYPFARHRCDGKGTCAVSTHISAQRCALVTPAGLTLKCSVLSKWLVTSVRRQRCLQMSPNPPGSCPCAQIPMDSGTACQIDALIIAALSRCLCLVGTIFSATLS